MQCAIGSEVFRPELAPGATESRSFQVRVERAAAEAGEMLAAADDALRGQAAEKLARVSDDAFCALGLRRACP